MRRSLALAFMSILLSGLACAEEQPVAPARDAVPGTRNEATPQSGSSEPTAPATQESQGLRLDQGSGTAPASKAHGTGPGEDCTNAGAAASASGPNATADCGPGGIRTQRH